MNQYANKVKQQNLMEEEFERQKWMKRYNAKRDAAMENLNRSFKKKEDEKAQIIEMHKRYSPKYKDQLQSMSLDQNQLDDRLKTSPKFIPEPEYDDMFNSVFYKKKHRAYQLRERAERREKMLEEKYNDHLM